MRLAFLALIAAATCACATTLPLTTKDVSLMLRSGYSVRAVEQELASRHFADTMDDAKRTQLIQAGATAELIDGLAQGKFAVPKDEMEKAKRKLEEQARERALAAKQAKETDTLYQSDLAKTRAANQALSQGDVIAGILKGNLVRSQNGLLVSYFDEQLSNKKIYGLYFSAHWCPPCRKFTPQLVSYYNSIAREHPEFEIIFVSADKTVDAMSDYMRDTGMPWPAVEFAKVNGMASLLRYCGKGIPDLVIVDSSGKVLADSFVNGNYVGPQAALEQLSTILGTPSLAAAH